ncbi:MAG: HEAT repeat domain-containing protein [Alphaproteobacteria bacterium]|nr:HEAT repeat domain-containing protein [Alphaproteobacteria bacterium]MCB9931717.1 HEAT repeat domain-containing protein [Alphaproteobacteria bacterium]
MLTAVWTLSLVLIAASLLAAIALVLRRMITDRRAKTTNAVRKQLLTALVWFSNDGNTAKLLTALRHAPPHIVADAITEFLALVRGDDRETIIAALHRFGLPEFLARVLKKGSQPRRFHAAELLAAFPAHVAIPHLQEALDADPSQDVRLAAAMALADLQALPPLSLIMARLGRGEQYSWRLNDLFRRLPTERADELERIAMAEDAPDLVRSAAIDALVPIRGMYAREQFEALAAAPSPTVAGAAIRALGYVGDSNSSEVLAHAMGSSNWDVRADAAEAAGRLGDTALLNRLAGLLNDPVWAVRYAAAKAMRRAGARGDRLLQEAATCGPPRSQRTASLVLAEGASQ